MSDDRFSISQVARRFGIPVSTLRYYDELRLLPAAERRGNVRHYGQEELRQLALIQRLHHHGLVSLADTAALIAERPEANHPSGREVLTASIDAIERKIDGLRSAQRLLEYLLSCPKPDPVRECAHLHAELERAVDNALAGPGGITESGGNAEHGGNAESGGITGSSENAEPGGITGSGGNSAERVSASGE
ncbi:MerR family transcriptional regulator [Streptomyces sp. NPDC003077]|uniref:MerR family transcriptional regulator n=1 Tax=Streptomyces sp. NPDC003077 TaxID=3154443 RepID=UPI00339EF384